MSNFDLLNKKLRELAELEYRLSVVNEHISKSREPISDAEHEVDKILAEIKQTEEQLAVLKLKLFNQQENLASAISTQGENINTLALIKGAIKHTREEISELGKALLNERGRICWDQLDNADNKDTMVAAIEFVKNYMEGVPGWEMPWFEQNCGHSEKVGKLKAFFIRFAKKH